jgi:hypothetical protein
MLNKSRKICVQTENDNFINYYFINLYVSNLLFARDLLLSSLINKSRMYYRN